MSDYMHPDWIDDNPYWEQERANDRDEYDQHVRHVEEDERDDHRRRRPPEGTDRPHEVDVTFTPTSLTRLSAVVIYQEKWVRDWRWLWLRKKQVDDEIIDWKVMD